MSQQTPEIPFMASLWIRSGCDMKVDPSVETYQMGAHFKAVIKATLAHAKTKGRECYFRPSLHFKIADFTEKLYPTQCCPSICDCQKIGLLQSLFRLDQTVDLCL